MKRCLKKLLDVFGKLKRLNMKTTVIKLILYQKNARSNKFRDLLVKFW